MVKQQALLIVKQQTLFMEKLLFLIIIFLASFTFSPARVSAHSATNTAVFSGVLKASCDLNDGPDYRVEKLTIFLNSQNSPLSEYAPELIEAADNYNLDWKLVAAITGVESSFGKRIPYNSYNAYGWNNGDYKFGSWEQSIDHVSRVLKTKYLDRGATNVWSIGKIYAASPTWASRVNLFMTKIEATQNYTLDL